MATVIQDQFVHNYSKLLIQAWTDRTFMMRLQQSPAQVLKDSGIAIPSTVTINIVTDLAAPSSASLKSQVDAWDQVVNTGGGTFNLYIPQQPQIFQSTSSASEGFNVQDTTACCCCCPCCTCT